MINLGLNNSCNYSITSTTDRAKLIVDNDKINENSIIIQG